MDVAKENIIKFIEELIVDNYSKANGFLTKIVEEKVAQKIKKAAKLTKVFGKSKECCEPKKKVSKKPKKTSKSK